MTKPVPIRAEDPVVPLEAESIDLWRQAQSFSTASPRQLIQIYPAITEARDYLNQAIDRAKEVMQ